MKEFSYMGKSKTETYNRIVMQLEEIMKNLKNPISIMAHVCACLKEYFRFLWVGYYIKHGEKLQIGPYQGPPACLEIPFGKGVCGTAWKENRILIVPDVNKFPNHIACSSLSKSEIVVPLYNINGQFYGVLDVDSENLSNFDEIDAYYLEKINLSLGRVIYD